jgi:hypothetical protein
VLLDRPASDDRLQALSLSTRYPAIDSPVVPDFEMALTRSLRVSRSSKAAVSSGSTLSRTYKRGPCRRLVELNSFQ